MAKKSEAKRGGPFKPDDMGRQLVLGDGTKGTITFVHEDGRITVTTEAGRSIPNLGLGSVLSIEPAKKKSAGPRKARRYRPLGLRDPWPFKQHRDVPTADVIREDPGYVRWCRDNLDLELEDGAFALLEQQP